MSVFRFRRFAVENIESAMKVNTDGVLLGALMTVRPTDRLSLDIGTGTGTIALMAAQRLSDLSSEPENHKTQTQPQQPQPQQPHPQRTQPHQPQPQQSQPRQPQTPEPQKPSHKIIAIDIDGPSAKEAAKNFAASPWPETLISIHSSLADFHFPDEENHPKTLPDTNKTTPEPNPQFDHIFSNPPYYDLSLAAPDPRRHTARHTQSLSYREILDFSAGALRCNAVLSLILPSDTETPLLRHAKMIGLHPFRIVRIKTTPKKRPTRIVVEFEKSTPENLRIPPREEELIIQTPEGYTTEYQQLTSPFYIR